MPVSSVSKKLRVCCYLAIPRSPSPRFPVWTLRESGGKTTLPLLVPGIPGTFHGLLAVYDLGGC